MRVLPARSSRCVARHHHVDGGVSNGARESSYGDTGEPWPCGSGLRGRLRAASAMAQVADSILATRRSSTGGAGAGAYSRLASTMDPWRCCRARRAAAACWGRSQRACGRVTPSAGAARDDRVCGQLGGFSLEDAACADCCWRASKRTARSRGRRGAMAWRCRDRRRGGRAWSRVRHTHASHRAGQRYVRDLDRCAELDSVDHATSSPRRAAEPQRRCAPRHDEADQPTPRRPSTPPGRRQAPFADALPDCMKA